MDSSLRAAIAAELQVDPDEFVSDRTLESFGTWDSLVSLSVMVLLGDALGVPIEPAEMARLKTVADIEALVLSKRK